MNRQASLLRGVCLLGLVVFLVLLGTLIFVSIHGGVPLLSPIRLRISSFTQALEEYDQKDKDGLSFRQHNSLLDALEKKAVDTESTLSVLKRRRYRAFHAPSDREQYLNSYILSAARSQKQYPHSAQIAAIAAEALILSGFSGEGEMAAELQELASLMSEGSLTNLSLAFSVFAGSMKDPAQAVHLKRELFTLLCSLAEREERERYLVNSCIRTILENNSNEAFVMVNALFSESPIRDETIIFGAEYFYDFRNYLRSAELFSAFTDSQNLGRQADALWLAGFSDSARGLWRVAAADTGNAANDNIADLPSVKARSYYNLGSTTANKQEAGYYLEQLFAANASYEQGRIFGILRYSRIVPTDRALAILSQTDYEHEGLYDLEMLRRRSEDWDVDKSVAETWLLLNRHNNDERLFEWAAWYFDFQHRYDETALALRNAGINRVEGPWSALHRAYALIRQRDYAEAEKMLRSIVRSPQEIKSAPGRRTQPLWQAAADLAMLLEKQNNLQEALQYYEIASAQLSGLIARPSMASPPEAFLPDEEQSIPAAGISLERRDAARIQLRIASILRALGKTPESVRALDYALDLDPENMEARLEKRRIEAERGFL